MIDWKAIGRIFKPAPRLTPADELAKTLPPAPVAVPDLPIVRYTLSQSLSDDVINRLISVAGARGQHLFTGPEFRNYITAYAPGLGMDTDQAVESLMQEDFPLTMRLFALKLEDIALELENQGMTPTAPALLLAFNVGVTCTRRIYDYKPRAFVSHILSAEQLAAMPEVRDMTCGEVIGWATRVYSTVRPFDYVGEHFARG